jgi:hypothetical protein
MKFKSGKYYIGDPSHVFDETIWDEILNITENFSDDSPYIFNDFKFLGASIQYDHGYFTDNCGNDYHVDSGYIAILPIEMLNISNILTEKELNDSDYSHVINYKKDFNAEISNGIFTFGNIEINTNMDDEIYERDDEINDNFNDYDDD